MESLTQDKSHLCIHRQPDGKVKSIQVTREGKTGPIRRAAKASGLTEPTFISLSRRVTVKGRTYLKLLKIT